MLHAKESVWIGTSITTSCHGVNLKHLLLHLTLWPLLHDSGTIYTNISNLSLWFHQTEDDQMSADSSCLSLGCRVGTFSTLLLLQLKPVPRVNLWSFDEKNKGVKPFLVSCIYEIEILKIDLPQIHHIFWCLIAFLLLLDLLKIDRYKSISIVEAVGNPVCFACSSRAINLNRTWFNCKWDLLFTYLVYIVVTFFHSSAFSWKTRFTFLWSSMFSWWMWCPCNKINYAIPNSKYEFKTGDIDIAC